MKKRLQKMLAPNSVMFYVLFFLFAVVGLYFSRVYGAAGIVVCIILRIVSLRTNAARQRQVQELMNNIEVDGGEIRPAVTRSPLPTAVALATTGEIVWANDAFAEISGRGTAVSGVRMGEIAPTFETGWLIKGQTAFPGELGIGKRQYHVFGSLVQSGAGQLMMLHFIDCTEFVRLRDAAETTRPAIAVIAIDNYEDLVKNTTDSEKSNILAGIDKRLFAWVKDSSAVLRKYDRDKYIFVIESAELDKLVARKFSVLQEVREIENHEGVVATLSIGIGRDGETLAESYQFAGLAIDMALSRGGDQAVIKDRFNFTFYGSRTKETDRHTRVRSRVVAGSLSELIGQSSTIYIMGHRMADLDALGSAVGLLCLCRTKGRPARIVIDLQKNACQSLIEELKASQDYADLFISGQDALVEADNRSLLIVVDTNRPDQVECKPLLESISRVAVIDHHRRAADYIEQPVLNLHEPYASSASELVTELLQYAVNQRDVKPLEAQALLAGIVLDTKNFSIRTGSRTFESAAYLRKAGADPVEVKKLFQSDLDDTLMRYRVVQAARLYRSELAIACIDETITRVIASQAADELINISGITASFVLFPDREQVIISARSIGSCNVQAVLEKLGGGGNGATAGAQIKGKPLREVLQELVAAIDAFYS